MKESILDKDSDLFLSRGGRKKLPISKSAELFVSPTNPQLYGMNKIVDYQSKVATPLRPCVYSNISVRISPDEGSPIKWCEWGGGVSSTPIKYMSSSISSLSLHRILAIR